MPDTSVVFFSENANETAAGTHQKLWDVDSNNITRCLDKKQISLNQGEGGVSIIGAINSKTILEKIWQRESGDILVTMSLPDCRMTRVGPISASDANIRFSGLNNSYSLSGENIALATREQTVVVRDTRTLDIKKEINAPADLRLGEQVIFTPDGKFLITLASNTIGDKPETHRYLLFFETQKYELVRQMDVTAWSPPNLGADAFHESNFIGTVMAISGDGNLIAIGFTRTEKKFQTTMEQAEVVLFDLKTGAEVAKARHPAIKQTRDDPFAARIGKLIFTSDGKYLLSSTHDTLVWELKR
jgi:WD40 repeat protein